MIEPQLPIFRAFCTTEVLMPALSEMRTNQVPTIEKRIPTPAISIGRRMGEKPSNPSSRDTRLVMEAVPVTSCPSTMVARTVAT
jgi:hypothetical protein